MLGVVTEVTVKLIPKPACAQVVMASFASVEAAGNAVTQVIAAGMIPAGLEMMDRRATHMVEPFVRAGYDMDAQAILLCESDGTPEEVAHEIARMEAVFRDAGATRCQVSASEAERLKFWAGRKNAFPAAGRVSPDYYCMDGTIPRRHLARVLGAIEQMEDDFGLRCANVFHAGDGNLHPLILFDSNKPDEVERAEKFGAAILELCVQVGGTVTGEHGVGMEKINQMCVQFSREELDAFLAVKRAFDPPCLLNPEKSSPRWHVAPNTARCMCMGRAELSRSRPLLGRTPYGFRPVGLCDQVMTARAGHKPLFVMGGGSKSFYGNYRPVTPQDGHCLLDMTPYRGIVNYHPSELVVTVRAGTPLADLEAELAAHGQMLAFEPPHFGPAATVGGCVAAGLSGPRRMSAGALRDFVLGARLLDSDGRMLSFGGEVMKNVAGYDVSRLLAGSHGIFGALLEVLARSCRSPCRK